MEIANVSGQDITVSRMDFSNPIPVQEESARVVDGSDAVQVVSDERVGSNIDTYA